MDALQPPHPFDKKTTAFDMAHISSPCLTDAAAAALSCCFFLFYSSPFLCFFFSSATHGNIKEPFVPFQCCGHKSYRDLFDCLSSN